MRSQGAFGRAGDPLGDPLVALRGSYYLEAGPPVRNHVEHRVASYQAVSARPHLMTPPVSQGFGYPESM